MENEAKFLEGLLYGVRRVNSIMIEHERWREWAKKIFGLQYVDTGEAGSTLRDRIEKIIDASLRFEGSNRDLSEEVQRLLRCNAALEKDYQDSQRSTRAREYQEWIQWAREARGDGRPWTDAELRSWIQNRVEASFSGRSEYHIDLEPTTEGITVDLRGPLTDTEIAVIRRDLRDRGLISMARKD